MLGFIIGAISGALQFWLLSKYTAAIISGQYGTKMILFAVSQFLIPLAVLLGCAFILFESLHWAGAGMAASLMACAAFRFLVSGKRR